MIKKTGKEVANKQTARDGDGIPDNELYEWLSNATASDIREYLRWVGSYSPSWSAYARDALNVLLANENIKLQTDIRGMTEKLNRMTKWIIGLTVVIVILTFIQAIPILNTFIDSFNDVTESSLGTQKPKNNANQRNDTSQLHNENNNAYIKTKVFNHQ